MRRIYLDANGAAPSLPEAREKLVEIANLVGNPSSFHDHGRILRSIIDEARHHVSIAVGAKEKDVVFTSGASEANRLFVDALIEWGRANDRKPRVLMSPFEHPSLLKPILKARDCGIFWVDIIDLDSDGSLRESSTELQNADVVICCQAHNETGILPNISGLLDKVGPETLVMSDISQAVVRISGVAKRVDVVTLSAQKIGGFAGVGALVLRGIGKRLPAPWLGGGQERGFRPGTESAVLIAAFGEAAKHVERERIMHQKLAELRDYFEATLKKRLPVKIIGHNGPRLPNTSAICFLDQDPDALRIACDMAGLSVGFGAACSGLAPEGSFALKRLGLSHQEERATVRFSLHRTTSKADIDETIERLGRLGTGAELFMPSYQP